MKNDYPQLQLENSKKQSDVMHANCSIMIPNETIQSTAYAVKTVHTAIFKHSKVQSTIKDPVMRLLVKKNSKNNSFYLLFPIKYLINCTDNSMLQIHETDASQLYKSHPIFKKKQLLINAVCKKNPSLAGKSFAEQFDNAMNKFYQNPGLPWLNHPEENEALENAGIIIHTAVPTLRYIITPYGPQAILIKKLTFDHGPNGCVNEKKIIETIVEPYIQSHSNSVYQFVIGRQYGNDYNKKLQPNSCTYF